MYRVVINVRLVGGHYLSLTFAKSSQSNGTVELNPFREDGRGGDPDLARRKKESIVTGGRSSE